MHSFAFAGRTTAFDGTQRRAGICPDDNYGCGLAEVGAHLTASLCVGVTDNNPEMNIFLGTGGKMGDA